MDKKSYTIKFVITIKDLKVLKSALSNYRGAKRITTDLLGIVQRQEALQNENT